jgi:hypothetical protein
MDSLVSIVFVTTILYIVVKTIDMKYIKKEMRPLKEMVHDAAVVAVSCGLAVFAVFSLNKPVGGFIDAITEKTAIPAAANVFTGDPGF